MEIGSIVGSYRLDRVLGRGGMGAVFAATHQLLGRTAAVKLLLPAMSEDPAILQRFFNEARAASAIKHPSIVEIYDYGQVEGGSAYIVMELCDGESLGVRLRRSQRLPVAAAVGLARQIASALAVAHAAGIIHRDLKPDNVFIVKDPEVTGGERIKLLDFGIAKLAGDSKVSGADDTAATQTGQLLGTPYYMAPEQCRGAGKVDARADLYSLGCMLFQMVTGSLPFTGEGTGEIIAAHIHVAPKPVREVAPHVAAPVATAIAKLLEKDPADRYQTAQAVADALANVSSGPSDAFAETSASESRPIPVVTAPVRRSRVVPALLLAGGLAVALGSWFARPGAYPTGSPVPVALDGARIAGASATVAVRPGERDLDVAVTGLHAPEAPLTVVDTAHPDWWATSAQLANPRRVGLAVVVPRDPQVFGALAFELGEAHLADALDDSTAAVVLYSGTVDVIAPRVPLADLPRALRSGGNDATDTQRDVANATNAGIAQVAQMDVDRRMVVIVVDDLRDLDGLTDRIQRSNIEVATIGPHDKVDAAIAGIKSRLTDRFSARVPGATLAWDGEPHTLQVYSGDARVGEPSVVTLSPATPVHGSARGVFAFFSLLGSMVALGGIILLVRAFQA